MYVQTCVRWRCRVSNVVYFHLIFMLISDKNKLVTNMSSSRSLNKLSGSGSNTSTEDLFVNVFRSCCLLCKLYLKLSAFYKHIFLACMPFRYLGISSLLLYLPWSGCPATQRKSIKDILTLHIRGWKSPSTCMQRQKATSLECNIHFQLPWSTGNEEKVHHCDEG